MFEKQKNIKKKEVVVYFNKRNVYI